MSTVIDEILAERHCGSVHCGTTDADSLEGAAAVFGLATGAAIFREIDREIARNLIIELLHSRPRIQHGAHILGARYGSR